MSTYTQIIYQIVFSTKYRRKTLLKPAREKVFAYMLGILKNKKCHPYIINGVEDHVHILTHIHPTISLAALVKEIKISSHKLIDEQGLLPEFGNWQNGYGAFTYSVDSLHNLLRYIENQEAHHQSDSFEAEYKRLLEEHGVEYDERYIFE